MPRLIDADALIIAFCECPAFSVSMFKKVRSVIQKAKVIEAEPVKHGRWIDNIDDNGVQCNAWRKCSSCGGLNWSKKPNYCPNCGAKMDIS